MNSKNKEILKEAISLWWLRPENGLALASYTIHGNSLIPKVDEVCADYACGDGVNTFFKCGGRFQNDFDLFNGGIDLSSHKKIVSEKIDVFDHFDSDYDPRISLKPETKYRYGTDHKKNLLDKANLLHFYEELIHANLNDNTDIPQESLDLAYCNSLYWVANHENALSWIAEKVKNDGRIILDVMTKNKYLLDYNKLFPAVDSQWAELLNRGRMENNPGLKLPQEWEKLFKKMNLNIVDRREIFPSSLMKIWNVGLRPIFPMLQKMERCLNSENRAEIKDEWVATFTDLLLPILEQPREFSKDLTEYRIQYTLEK